MKNFLKILGVLLCVAAIVFVALLESGVAIPYVQNYKNNLKKKKNKVPIHATNMEEPEKHYAK